VGSAFEPADVQIVETAASSEEQTEETPDDGMDEMEDQQDSVLAL